MKTASIERRIIIVLFIIVLAVFSFAERDTKKLEQQMYSTGMHLHPSEIASTEKPTATKVATP